ncbi:Hint domain-containing protein [Roseobacter sinensis]|uniref:Hint domain-containing protein n=1 Tax=Roseobacter sinensis TaxID=2931391 RepID=A0ABT3BBR6_9RHOB|nr:Hint domain-containing protein [Roseobacter sp. WL0113]MCV3271009.1 Hint domain-containing protein [Roseobacter sp. WL0113]
MGESITDPNAAYLGAFSSSEQLEAITQDDCAGVETALSEGGLTQLADDQPRSTHQSGGLRDMPAARSDDVIRHLGQSESFKREPAAEIVEAVQKAATPICFTPGTLITTPHGQRAVDDLRPGDRVITRDNGLRTISWIGRRRLSGKELSRAPHLGPVMIPKGCLGAGLPARDMLLSPNHRVLVSNSQTQLCFEEREVLVAAKHLASLPGVQRSVVPAITYIHIMFEQHEVILSDGAWTESFQPADQSLGGLDHAQRSTLEELFPELRTPAGRLSYPAARRLLKRSEAKRLTRALSGCSAPPAQPAMRPNLRVCRDHGGRAGPARG